MSFLIRAAAAYVGLVGTAIAVHLIITPLYHPGVTIPVVTPPLRPGT